MVTPLSNDPAAAAHGQTADFADSMRTLMMMGMAEATIVTCIESWGQLRGQGVSDADATKKIASFRGGASGTTVEAVIRSRVQSEHGHSGYLPPVWVLPEKRLVSLMVDSLASENHFECAVVARGGHEGREGWRGGSPALHMSPLDLSRSWRFRC